MAATPDHISMALFCDFENVALGVRDANYEKFDIKKVLERLLLKGSIVVKKAYCDWDRYKGFKAPMHEANFEMIEIPHVRQSGKNSADIRMVVDALDLCYTKAHVNTFVIISGDSDFSPLVSKLRENAKYVIGVGVKQSTSDLLIANCDEFIFYDDLVRDSNRQRKDSRDQPQPRRSPEEEAKRRAEMENRRTKAVELAAETYEALVTDRDEGGRIWASVLKEAIKRRNPGFNENYYGFRTFGNLLEEARARGLLDFGRDEKSGTYVSRGSGVPTVSVGAAPVSQGQQLATLPTPPLASTARGEPAMDETEDAAQMADTSAAEADTMPATATDTAPRPSAKRSRGGRNGNRRGNKPDAANQPSNETPVSEPAQPETAPDAHAAPVEPTPAAKQARGGRGSGRRTPRSEAVTAAPTAPLPVTPVAPVDAPAATATQPAPDSDAGPAAKTRRGGSRRKPAAKKTPASTNGSTD